MSWPFCKPSARRLIAELKATWPDFPAAMLVGKIFHDGTSISRDILGTLEKYGFRSDRG